jgi:hypothetical protein
LKLVYTKEYGTFSSVDYIIQLIDARKETCRI